MWPAGGHLSPVPIVPFPKNNNKTEREEGGRTVVTVTVLRAMMHGHDMPSLRSVPAKKHLLHVR